MTESEALTKWCPMFRSSVAARSDGGESFTTNRDDYLPSRSSHCIGHNCMAWRVQTTFDAQGNYVRKAIDGFCGLACRP